VLKRDGLIDEVVLATGGTYAEAKSTVEAILDVAPTQPCTRVCQSSAGCRVGDLFFRRLRVQVRQSLPKSIRRHEATTQTRAHHRL
jgi:hypothetical protein